ncbi:MAG: glucose-6-phosphate dehydrogenase [Parcubacteria group bacterium]|nr:glucose-6-phosphate dehydrogenase [Parcubacteria group bacterium]
MDTTMDGKQALPITLIIFGASGDLMALKIAPTLLRLFTRRLLPARFHVVGFARRPYTSEVFQQYLRRELESHPSTKSVVVPDEFLKLISYQSGQFEREEDYHVLGKRLTELDESLGSCSQKLFYLAVPPRYYETIFTNLAKSGITRPCKPGESWARVIVEKPFGEDLASAQRLDTLLASLFEENQIYRIDHYLAKEVVQNIMSFRFANTFFEGGWNNLFIERIELRILETLGVEDRGAFYDTVGALRDVGQNHLLQMLALITMDQPLDLVASSIRVKRAQLLSHLTPLSREERAHSTFRAQYDGYRTIKGVSPNSETETYFQLKLFLTAPRWQGVPIIIESGKRMPERRKEIVVTFRHPSPCFCPPGTNEHYRNQIIFSLEPHEKITLRFWLKKPGRGFAPKEHNLDFLLVSEGEQEAALTEYERLLLDCIEGDQTLFVSSAEVNATWQFIDPILAAWRRGEIPLRTYTPDTDEVRKIAEAEAT